MTKFTIELPETFGFTRAGQTFTVESGKLPKDIVTQLVMHGATQKIGDAAAGKADADAMTAMQAVYESLVNGDWGRSRGGGGEEPIMRFIREQVRMLLTGDNKAKYAAMKGDSDGRNTFLEELFEAQTEANQAAIRSAAEEAMEEERRKKAAAKERVAKLGLSL